MTAVQRDPLRVWFVVASMLLGSLGAVARAESPPVAPNESSRPTSSRGFHLDADVRALRDSGVGDELELAYAIALGALDPSLLTDDEALVAIDRVVCDAAEQHAFVCHVFGRFDPRFVARHRTSADSNRFEIRAPSFDRALEREVGQDEPSAPSVLRGLACDATHLIVEVEGASDVTCATAVPSATPGAAFSLDMNIPGMQPGVKGASMRFAIDERVTARLHVESTDEAAARRLADAYIASLREGLLPVARLPGLAVHSEAPTVRGPSLDLVASIEIINLRENVGNLLHAVVRERVGRGRSDENAAEPTAEIDDLETIVLPRARGAFCSTSGTNAACDAATRLVALVSEEEEDIADELYTDEAWERVWVVAPDHQIAGLATSFGTGLDTHAYVETSLARSADGPTCEADCVLVASGTASELAIELATKHPDRFSSVLLVAPARVDPLPPFARIELLASGVDVFVASLGVDFFETREEHRVRRADAAAFERALRTLPVAGARGRVMHGTLRSGLVWLGRAARRTGGRVGLTSGRLRSLFAPGPEAEPRTRAAVGCREGDAAACASLAAAWREGSEAARSSLRVRACALGHGPTCFDEMYFPWASFPLAAMRLGPNLGSMLRHACRGGSGDACNQLAIAFEEGTLAPRSSSLAVELYAQGCDLGSPYACHNAVLHLAGGPALIDPRLRGFRERVRAAVARPEVFAAIQAVPTLDVARITAFRDAGAHERNAGGGDAPR